MVAMTEVFRVYLARGYFCPPTILWVATFPSHTYGHKALNIVKLMNQLLKTKWGLLTVDLLNEMWRITVRSGGRKNTAVTCFYFDFAA